MREYSIWLGMISRCYDPKNVAYTRYGGRGIYVCDRWKESFDNFYSDMGKRPGRFSLDRVDNDGPYSKENCRWASGRTQAANKSNSKQQVEIAKPKVVLAKLIFHKSGKKKLLQARVNENLYNQLLDILDKENIKITEFFEAAIQCFLDEQ